MALRSIQDTWAYRSGLSARRNSHSLSFDGVDGYVTMGNVAAFNFERTDSFSIVFWYKTSATAGKLIAVSKQLSTGNKNGWQLQLDLDNAGFDVWYARLVSTDATNELKVGVNSFAANDFVGGVWRHLAFVYTGTSTPAGCNFYLDGNKQIARNTAVNLLSASIQGTAPVNLSSRDNQATFNPWSGNLDEVAGYNVALTDAQVRAIYNEGVPLDLRTLATAGNLIGYWPVDNDVSTIITDRSSGGNNGTMTNMVAGDIVTAVP